MQKRLKPQWGMLHLQSDYWNSCKHFKRNREDLNFNNEFIQVLTMWLLFCFFTSLLYLMDLLISSKVPPCNCLQSSMDLSHHHHHCHHSLKAHWPVPALLLCSSQSRRWKTSLAAKHQSNYKVWLSLARSPHTVRHPSDPIVQEKVSASTVRVYNQRPSLCQVVQLFPRKPISPLMRPGWLNPVKRMTSEKLVPSQLTWQTHSYTNRRTTQKYLHRCRGSCSFTLTSRPSSKNCPTCVLPKTFCTTGSCQAVFRKADIL